MGRGRAISPVVGVLLLIMIAVASALLIYVWLMGYYATLKEPKRIEEITIESVAYENGGVTLFVRNRDIVKVHIVKVLFQRIDASDYRSVDVDYWVKPNDVVRIQVSVSLPEDSTWLVKVICENGGEAQKLIYIR